MWIAIKSDKLAFSRAFSLRKYKPKMLSIPLAMVNMWDCQYFSLSHKMSSTLSKLLQCTCSVSLILRY